MDGLKGICAVVIVLFHYYQVFCSRDLSLLPFPFYGLFSRGWYLVELFFMISGFLMANKYEGQELNVSFGEWIIPKLYKIMPLFVLSNFIIVISALLDKRFIHSNILPSVTLWGIIRSCLPCNFGWCGENFPYNTPGWFVSVLFLMYTIYFFVVKIKKNNPSMYLPLCTIMAFLGWGLCTLNWDVPFCYTNTARGYLCFFMGVLLHHFFKRSFPQWTAILSLSFLGALAILIHQYGMELVLGNIRYSLVFIVFPVLLFVITQMSALQKILLIPPICYLGKISMSLFLMHWPVMQIIRWFDAISGGGVIEPSNRMTFGIILLIVLAVSACEYEICEKRLFPYCIPKIAATLKKDN